MEWEIGSSAGLMNFLCYLVELEFMLTHRLRCSEVIELFLRENISHFWIIFTSDSEPTFFEFFFSVPIRICFNTFQFNWIIDSENHENFAFFINFFFYFAQTEFLFEIHLPFYFLFRLKKFVWHFDWIRSLWTHAFCDKHMLICR